jgi:hypothetical protein
MEVGGVPALDGGDHALDVGLDGLIGALEAGNGQGFALRWRGCVFGIHGDFLGLAG